MRVLVIRPEPDATRTADFLHARGHTALVAPVLETRFLAPDLPATADATVLTSANAARALAGRRAAAPFLDRPLVAVGAATAAAARAAGFSNVVSADGRAADAAAAVAALGLPAGGRVFYPAAAERADPLDERLAALGLAVALVPVYRTVAVAAWPTATVAAVAGGDLDVVQVMSRRSGAALLALVVRHGLQNALSRLALHAIAAEAVTPDLAAAVASVTLAPRPNLDGLLACLAPAADGSSSMR